MAVGRYSKYIQPFSYGTDYLLIICILLYLVPHYSFNKFHYLIIVFSWTIIATVTQYYAIYRFTTVSTIFLKIIKHFFVFSLTLVFLIYLFKINITPKRTLACLFYLFFLSSSYKFFVYYLLRKFRKFFGGNLRKVIIIGNSNKVDDLVTFFKNNIDLGYNLQGIIKPNHNINTVLNTIQEIKIDEIYCDLNSVTKEHSNEIIALAHSQFKTIKLIPDNSVLSHNMFLDYYGYLPLIAIRKTPLELWYNYWSKRLFDILFSLVVLLFILSWLIPLLAIIIKFDSKGPLFFKQKRHGINNQEFDCYKFRSMKINTQANTLLASKNDARITKLGQFLRKTSLDEMPQFINVFIGNMSVVGPRPQMLSVNEDYAKRFDKFMQRHYIKPGITGLAQVNGLRGEMLTNKDIENRLKYDLFYIEKWNLLLDFKIILITIKNVILGDDRAY